MRIASRLTGSGVTAFATATDLPPAHEPSSFPVAPTDETTSRNRGRPYPLAAVGTTTPFADVLTAPTAGDGF